MERKYRLSVSSIVSFDDKDKALEDKLLSGCSNAEDKEAIDLAIQELEETATGIYFTMELI